MNLEMWTSPLMTAALRVLGGFGAVYAVGSLLALLAGRERWLPLAALMGAVAGGLLAYNGQSLNELKLPEVRPAAMVEPAPDPSVSPPPASPPDGVPVAVPEAPVAAPVETPPEPVAPVAPSPPPADVSSLPSLEVFAGRDADLLAKACERIFNGVFPGDRSRFDTLSAIHKQAIVDSFKPMLTPVVVEQSDLGTIARVHFNPDAVKKMLTGMGYDFRKVQIAFKVKENFSTLDERVAATLADRQIREQSRYWLGDGWFTERHKLTAEIEKMSLQADNGQTLRVAVLNNEPFWDTTRDVQMIELRVF